MGIVGESFLGLSRESLKLNPTSYGGRGNYEKSVHFVITSIQAQLARVESSGSPKTDRTGRRFMNLIRFPLVVLFPGQSTAPPFRLQDRETMELLVDGQPIYQSVSIRS